VTLEPGGQFELSGAPVSTLHETCAEVNQHLQQVSRLYLCVLVCSGLRFLPFLRQLALVLSDCCLVAVGSTYHNSSR
jgi:Glutamate-cysteine ligase family 2(GCS2)